MKNILSFKKFHLLKEAEEPLEEPQAEETAPEVEPEDDDSDKVTTPKRRSSVILKELMGEIRAHFIYWFSFGELSKLLVADGNDMTYEKRGLCIWAVENNNQSDAKYQWRIKISEAEIEGMVEKISKIRLSLDVFDYNKEYLVKSEEIDVPVNKLTEDFVINRINKIKETILKVPKDDKEVKRFKDNEKRMLDDDIY